MRFDLSFYKRRNVTVKLIALIFAGTFAISFFPPLLLPYAGKKIEDRSGDYKFQISHWNNEINKQLNVMIETGSFNRVDLKRGKIEVTQNFCEDLDLFNFHLQQLTRIIGYQAHTVGSFANEIGPSIERIEKNIDEKKRLEINSHIENFRKVMEIPPKKQQELNLLTNQFRSHCESSPHPASVEEQAKQILEFTASLQQLYLDEKSPLKMENDPFKDLRAMGNATDDLFSDYQYLVRKINDQAAQQESYKIALTAFISFLSLIFSFKEIVEAQKKIDKENSFEI